MLVPSRMRVWPAGAPIVRRCCSTPIGAAWPAMARWLLCHARRSSSRWL